MVEMLLQLLLLLTALDGAASLDLLALHDPCSKCVRIFTCTRMDGYAVIFSAVPYR